MKNYAGGLSVRPGSGVGLFAHTLSADQSHSLPWRKGDWKICQRGDHSMGIGKDQQSHIRKEKIEFFPCVLRDGYFQVYH